MLYAYLLSLAFTGIKKLCPQEEVTEASLMICMQIGNKSVSNSSVSGGILELVASEFTYGED
jgi:hypothetical protein